MGSSPPRTRWLPSGGLMGSHRIRLATAALGVLAICAAAPGAFAQDAPTPTPEQQVGSAFRTLKQETRHVPKRNLSKHNKSKLLKALKQARKVSKSSPCDAVDVLERYRR